MKRSRLGLQLLLVGTTALIGYATMYHWIEHRRVVKGPWLITFASESGVPVLRVNQTTLGITNLQIVFASAHAATIMAQTIDFSHARPWPYAVPFGQCVFMDTTFLPGTIALELFGHEIQFLPRVLTIDKVERPWRSDEMIELK
jgi:hypothetical protein